LGKPSGNIGGLKGGWYATSGREGAAHIEEIPEDETIRHSIEGGGSQGGRNGGGLL